MGLPGGDAVRADLVGAGHGSFTNACDFADALRSGPDETLRGYADVLAADTCAPELIPVSEAQRPHQQDAAGLPRPPPARRGRPTPRGRGHRPRSLTDPMGKQGPDHAQQQLTAPRGMSRARAGAVRRLARTACAFAVSSWSRCFAVSLYGNHEPGTMGLSKQPRRVRAAAAARGVPARRRCAHEGHDRGDRAGARRRRTRAALAW